MIRPDAVYLLIKGNPVPKGRPRFARRGRFISTYTPEKTRTYEDIVRQEAIRCMQGLMMFDEPLRIYVGAYLPIPKSFSKTKRALALDGKLRPSSRPDLDNFFKSATDPLNLVVFRDDSLIVSAHIEKHYSETPQMEIWVYPVSNKQNIFPGF